MTTADASERSREFRLDYGPELEAEIDRVVRRLGDAGHTGGAPARWVALQLLAEDRETCARLVADDPALAAILAEAREASRRVEERTGQDVETLIADRRYAWIHDVVGSAVERSGPDGPTWSDRLDRVLTHRLLGIPIFLAIMWIVFKIVTDVAAPFVDWVDATISGPVAGWVTDVVSVAGLEGTWVESVLVDGVVAGVGGVLVFVPILVFLYVALSILEDSGYMARAAFVMDRLMRSLGLHGKSFLPLLVGFGCNVPALYATRVLEERKDRILTGLMVPFVTCAARLPVFVLLAAIFFPANAGNVVFLMYVLSIVFVLGVGFVLSRTVFRGRERAPFVMELPPYRLPTFRATTTVTWQRVSAFLRKAGTIILGVSIVVWLLLAVPVTGGGSFNDTPVEDSAFAEVSDTVAPVFAPAGFDSWELTGSLLSGFVAKEVVIATMSQAYGVEEVADEPGDDPSVGEDVRSVVEGFGNAAKDAVLAVPRVFGVDFAETEDDDTALMSAVRADFEATSGGRGALAAFAFMLFVLLYVPCMATVAAAHHELGARWMWFSIALNTGVAWVVATAVFQVGRAMGG
jgi:ferrous iron transport protein B